MNSRALLRQPKRCPRVLVHSWCISGALLVHSWCTFHSWCTSGALLVHSWCTPGALSVHFWCTLGALQRFSRKGIASLPKGSLDPPHRNVWIAFSSLTNPKGNCFTSERKPRSSAQKRWIGLTNPKGNCTSSERKPRSSAQKRLDLANLQTRKGIAPLPKGSLDPPHRNVWIALCKGTGK